LLVDQSDLITLPPVITTAEAVEVAVAAVEDVVASMTVAVEVAEEVAVVASMIVAVEVDVVAVEAAPTVAALETSKARSRLLLKLALDGNATEHACRTRVLAPWRP
jgi:hypothetical protein